MSADPRRTLLTCYIWEEKCNIDVFLLYIVYLFHFAHLIACSDCLQTLWLNSINLTPFEVELDQLLVTFYSISFIYLFHPGQFIHFGCTA